MGVSNQSGQGKQFGGRMAYFLEVRGGTSVFIVVRCIAATRAVGTVYESINQSLCFGGGAAVHPGRGKGWGAFNLSCYLRP
jgi:hypothetical protein